MIVIQFTFYYKIIQIQVLLVRIDFNRTKDLLLCLQMIIIRLGICPFNNLEHGRVTIQTSARSQVKTTS